MKDSGIYLITNSINGKFYVGSSKCLKRREKDHFRALRKGTHHCYYLQNSFLKYKEEDFVFTIIEHCEPEILIEREQFYIDSLNPAYNICRYAKNSLGTKRTLETRIRISEAHKGQKAWNKGIPRTPEQKKAHSEKMTGRISPKKGVYKSENTIRKMLKKGKKKVLSLEHRRNLSKKVLVYSLSGEYLTFYYSLTEAAASVNSNHSNLARTIKNNKPFKKKIYKYE